MKKKAEWFIDEFQVGAVSTDSMQDSLSNLCDQGFEVVKIETITHRITMDKIRSELCDVPLNDQVSFGDRDQLRFENWTRVWFKKI